MRRYHPWTVLFYAIFFAAVFWNSRPSFWAAAPRPFEAFGQSYSAVSLGIDHVHCHSGYHCPLRAYFEAISLIRSTRASITATLEPISAGIISFFFLGDALEPLQVLGMVLVIAAVILFQLRREFDYQTPALIRTPESTKGNRSSFFVLGCSLLVLGSWFLRARGRFRLGLSIYETRIKLLIRYHGNRGNPRSTER